ncbi:MAG: hypothetical protein HQ575_03185 [Candidatus Omnitrophica bacterium]|nr:hypothetical protein [Candidatus Omnitrophota bacterium]
MIEINLLPDELKAKRKAFKIPDATAAFLPAAVGIAIFFVVTHLVFITVIRVNKAAYGKMERGWSSIREEKESIELIKRDGLSVKKRLDAIESLTHKKILWSKKLNQLSDLIIPGVWFTRVSIDKKTVVIEKNRTGLLKKDIGTSSRNKTSQNLIVSYLNIEGEVSSSFGDELAIIGKFIERLKSDADFFRDFSNIELVSTELNKIGDTETMSFKINSYFKEASVKKGTM